MKPPYKLTIIIESAGEEPTTVVYDDLGILDVTWNWGTRDKKPDDDKPTMLREIEHDGTFKVSLSGKKKE